MVDGILILLMLVFAISGYRQGFVIGALSFGGFFSGVLIGLQVGPLIADRFQGPTARLVVSLAVIFVLAVLGQTLAGWLGHHLRRAISSRPLQRLDDAGGALVSLVAVLLGSTPFPGLNREVRSSAILGRINVLMPEQAQALSSALRDTLDTSGFPDVFGGLAPTKAKEVAAPDPTLRKSQVVQRSRRSVIKVLGTAPSCSRRIEGTVVVYDPDRDLAVLYVPGLNAPVMPFVPRQAATGASAIVLGFPQDGPYDAQSARVRDVGKITGPDIYDSGDVTREIYTIRSLVRSGNSGGPLITPSGQVLGVIFAAAADDRNTGFALTADEAAPVAQQGVDRTRGTDTGDCA